MAGKVILQRPYPPIPTGSVTAATIRNGPSRGPLSHGNRPASRSVSGRFRRQILVLRSAHREERLVDVSRPAQGSDSPLRGASVAGQCHLHTDGHCLSRCQPTSLPRYRLTESSTSSKAVKWSMPSVVQAPGMNCWRRPAIGRGRLATTSSISSRSIAPEPSATAVKTMPPSGGITTSAMTSD